MDDESLARELMSMTTSKDSENLVQTPSLESVASPEQLDQLMQVVKPKDFIPVATMGAFTVLALIWGVVGRIPIAVTGQGILVSPEPIVEIQSPSSGQLETLAVKDNQCVKKGDIVATIKPTEDIQASLQETDKSTPANRTTQVQKQLKEHSLIRSPQDGCILEVSGMMGQIVNPGTRLGMLQMQGQGKSALLGIAYFDVKDGKRIKPGMKIQITPDTVKREQFGGIVAMVKSVSAYPITSTRAVAKIGNQELADMLTAKSAKVEVIAELAPEPKNASAYQWSSSKGPDMKLTSGTTSNVRVKVEERAPITFLLPFLREWSGIQ